MSLTAERLEKFQKIMKGAPDSCSIVSASFDPDAAGASAIMKTIAEHFGKRTAIYYGGNHTDPQNQLIFNEFGLRDKFRLLGDLPAESMIVLVDSSATADDRFPEGRVLKPLMVIDHHESSLNETDADWIWIHPYGAASTMTAMLMKALNVPFPDDKGETASLGAIGIASDTFGLASPETKDEDVDAYAFLKKAGRQDLIAKVRRFDYPGTFLDLEAQTTLNRRMAEDAMTITSVGFLKESEGWILARIADRLIREKGVETTLVWGFVGKKLMAKIRTADMSEDLNEILLRIFPKTCAGSKTGSGGGEKEIDSLIFPASPAAKEKFLEMMDDRFKELFPAAERKTGIPSDGKK